MLIGISACLVQTIPAAASSSSCCGLCFRCDRLYTKTPSDPSPPKAAGSLRETLCSLRLLRKDNETALANLRGSSADRGCCDCSVDDNEISICNPGREDLSGFR